MMCTRQNEPRKIPPSIPSEAGPRQPHAHVLGAVLQAGTSSDQPSVPDKCTSTMGLGGGPNKGGGRGGSMYSGRNATRASAAPPSRGGRGGRGGGRGGSKGTQGRKDFSVPGASAPSGGGGVAGDGRGGRGGGVVGIIKCDPPVRDKEREAELRREREEERRRLKEEKDLQHVGALTMAEANQDLVFDLLQELPGDDGSDSYAEHRPINEEDMANLEKRLTKMGFSSQQVHDAAEGCESVDPDTVLDYLVLHTPEEDLPKQLLHQPPEAGAAGATPSAFPGGGFEPFGRGQQQGRAGGGGGGGGGKKISAFLPAPIIVRPGQAFSGKAPEEQPPAPAPVPVPTGVVGVVKSTPAVQLSFKEEKAVQALVGMGFTRGESLEALKAARGDQQRALCSLMEGLMPAGHVMGIGGTEEEEEEEEDERFEERTALESIFDERFSELWFEVGQIVGVRVALDAPYEQVALAVRYDVPCRYPREAPRVLLHAAAGSGGIPGGQKRLLAASRELAAKAVAMAKRSAGEVLVFRLVEAATQILAESEAASGGRPPAAKGDAGAKKGKKEKAPKIVVAPPPVSKTDKVTGKQLTYEQRDAFNKAKERTVKKQEEAAKAAQSEEEKAAERKALFARLQKEAEEKDEREYQARLEMIRRKKAGLPPLPEPAEEPPAPAPAPAPA